MLVTLKKPTEESALRLEELTDTLVGLINIGAPSSEIVKARNAQLQATPIAVSVDDERSPFYVRQQKALKEGNKAYAKFIQPKLQPYQA